jgi:hypothetical protein
MDCLFWGSSVTVLVFGPWLLWRLVTLMEYILSLCWYLSNIFHILNQGHVYKDGCLTSYTKYILWLICTVAYCTQIKWASIQWYPCFLFPGDHVVIFRKSFCGSHKIAESLVVSNKKKFPFWFPVFVFGVQRQIIDVFVTSNKKAMYSCWNMRLRLNLSLLNVVTVRRVRVEMCSACSLIDITETGYKGFFFLLGNPVEGDALGD